MNVHVGRRDRVAYDGADRVIPDPDQQVQQALRVFFETFGRVGSATATVKEFRRLKLRFPRRVQRGARKGEILWGELEHHRARSVLHHPRYAGVFCFGRSRQRKHGDARYRRHRRCSPSSTRRIGSRPFGGVFGSTSGRIAGVEVSQSGARGELAWLRSPPSSRSMFGRHPPGPKIVRSTHHQYSSSVSPFQANTGTPAAAIAVAAWSCVEKTLHDDRGPLPQAR